MLKFFLIDRCHEALGEQRQDGSMAAGTNGGYGDSDTPVRNTAHWVFSFARAYRETGNDKFLKALQKGTDYILACGRSCAGGIVMRHSKGKDHTNGILGPSHVIEALGEANKIINSPVVAEFISSYIRSHEFNESAGCWNCFSPEGRLHSPDPTFNHQLYYAGVLAQNSQWEPEALEMLKKFSKGLSCALAIHEDGLIRHLIPAFDRPGRNFIKRIYKRTPLRMPKERDYHLYNLYGFSLLCEGGFDPASCLKEKWRKILKYTESNSFQIFLAEKEISTAPLCSGSETQLCDYVFYRKVFLKDDAAQYEQRLVRFLEKTNAPKGRAELFSPDPITQRARIYRYWRCASIGAGE
jgi:hypothetical protein